MPTERNPALFNFGSVEGRRVVAGFDGGRVTSDAGAPLLGAADRVVGPIERFAACFADGRSAKDVEHTVATLVGQRVFGIALGYEGLIDHGPAPPRPGARHAGREARGAAVAVCPARGEE